MPDEGLAVYATDCCGRTGPGMKGVVEKFTIKVTDSGVLITDQEQNSLRFTAGEALMLLDLLKDEEAHLRDMAEKASPLPVTRGV